jgi:hypothetical protein
METNSNEKQEIFIPLVPGINRRRGLMISTLVPGALLILSSLSPGGSTIGSVLLKIFNITAGGLVVFASVREFRKPGSMKWFGADMIMVLTGFLIIAQATSAFKLEKGFQPAHLLFVAAAITIFKGVMVPESKINRGCKINGSSIELKVSFLKTIKFDLSELKQLELIDNKLLFQMQNDTTLHANLNQYANAKEIYDALNTLSSKSNYLNRI